MQDFTADTALDVKRPAEWRLPMLFTSPHSGRDYPDGFLAQSRLDLLALRRSEDAWIDELLAFVPPLGAPLLSARFPRAYVDLNRDEREIDPAMFTPRPEDINYPLPTRVKAGLGMVARVIAADMPIYDQPLPLKEYVNRRDSCYRPWHAALRGLLDEGRSRFGGFLLVDCHSMPASVEGLNTGKKPLDIVLGDRYGASCHPGITDLFESAFERQGLNVRRNQPYAGGYITSHYGRPSEGCHSIQIEINRRLYMDQYRMQRHDGFDRLRHLMEAAFKDIAANLTPQYLDKGGQQDWQMADCAE